MVSRLGVRQLHMVGCSQLTDAALGRLAAMPALTHLDIGCNVNFSDQGVASLAAATGATPSPHLAPTLLFPTHHGEAAVADACRPLSMLAGLQQISLLSLAQLTNVGVIALGALPSLCRITLSRCPLICETGLRVPLLSVPPCMRKHWRARPSFPPPGLLLMQEVLACQLLPATLSLRIFMCGAPLRRSMVGWMASVLADLDSLLLIAH